MGARLAPDYAERIQHFKEKYENLLEFAADVHPEASLNVTWMTWILSTRFSRPSASISPSLQHGNVSLRRAVHRECASRL